MSSSLWTLVRLTNPGLVKHQIMFTAHDAAHLSITANFTVDTLIAMFVADFCCGLSIGWWKSSHNVHHLITNMPVRLTPDSDSFINTLTNHSNTTPTSKTFPYSPPAPLSSSPSAQPTTTSSLPGTPSPTSSSRTRVTLTTPSWPSRALTCTYCPGFTCLAAGRRVWGEVRRGGSAPRKLCLCAATGSCLDIACFGGRYLPGPSASCLSSSHTL